MNKQEYQDKKNSKAVAFFRKFIKLVMSGRVKIIHFGYCHIANGRFGLSMYWETEE